MGYGDRFPVTAAGRGVAVVLMLCGIGLVEAITANIASFFIEQRTNPLQDEVASIRAQLDRMKQMLMRQQDESRQRASSND